MKYSDDQLKCICAALGSLAHALGAPSVFVSKPYGRNGWIKDISDLCERLPHWFLAYTQASMVEVSAHPNLIKLYGDLLGCLSKCDTHSLNEQITLLRPLVQFPQASQPPPQALLGSLVALTKEFLCDVSLTTKKRARDGTFHAQTDNDENKPPRYRVINFLSPGDDGQKCQEALGVKYRKNNITVVPQPLNKTWQIFYNEEIEGHLRDLVLEIKEQSAADMLSRAGC